LFEKDLEYPIPLLQNVALKGRLPENHDILPAIDTFINNTELCWFLQLPSPRRATYLFSLMNLPHSGANKIRIYHQSNNPLSSNHVFPK
jgi:hypothetical protein